MHVVCVTGMPAAGKEEFQHVAADLGYGVIRMGDVVRDEARRRGLPITDGVVGTMAAEERRLRGPSIWAERTIPRVQGERIVIDGVRSLTELEAFRAAFGSDLKIFAVIASPETRWARVIRRHRPDDAATWDEFQRRDDREVGWGLDKVIAAADVRIENEGTLEDFYAKVREALGRIDG